MCDIYNGIRYCEVNNEYIVGNGTNVKNNAEENLQSMHLVIPKKVYGRKVEAIGQYAFYQNIRIIEVTIYARITHIDFAAFCRCINLISINIPSTCTKLGGYCLDQYEYIKEQQSDGSLNVFFEENSEIAEFDHNVFAWKNTLNLYFCEAVSIKFNDPTQFEEITNLNFYSKVQFSLPDGQQIIVIIYRLYFLIQKKNQVH